MPHSEPISRVCVLCCAQDVWLAKICVASVRFWYPNLRLTLIKDLTKGDFSTTEIERLWSADSEVLENARCGPGFAKIELLLKPARERFLILDSDTYLCGPVLRKFEGVSADFLVSRRDASNPHEDSFKRVFFDLERLKKIDRDFQFPGYAFNTGVYVATSGILTRDEFTPHVEFSSPMRLKDAKTFSCADQGVLNYLLMKGAAEGRLSLEPLDFMVWGFSDHAKWLKLDRIASGDGYESIMHYAGRKPTSIIAFPAADILLFYERFYYDRLRLRAVKKSRGEATGRKRA